jgi:nucleoid DNA-binding protein
VTKKDMAKAIAESMGISAAQVADVVQWVFDGIVEALENKGRIELRNFGVFEVKRRKARQARNPRTGAIVSVPEKFVVTFKPGKEMEERVSHLVEAHHPTHLQASSTENGPSNSEEN